MTDRPKLLVARSRADRFVQVGAVGAVVALMVYAARVWPDVPATVPIHFGLSGAPDAYGSRATLFLLPILATVSFLVLTFLERAPHVYNYPIEVTTANAPMVYDLGRRSILWLKLIIVVAFGLGFRASVEVALGNATALPGWFLPAVLGAIAATVLVTVVRMRRTGVELRG